MSVVIGIRGTNGSGKTTLARHIMALADDWTEHKMNESKVVITRSKTLNLVFIGSYKRVCGGCDTVSTPAMCYDAVVECAMFSNVIYEGVLVGTVFQPTMDLDTRLKAAGHKLRLICLNTSFEQAVENVNTRRAVEGKEPLAKLDNVMTNWKKHLSSAKKFREAGMDVHWVSQSEGYDLILEALDDIPF